MTSTIREISNLLRISTPEILWHGGGTDHGKADPVYSIDLHLTENILLTSGIDASVPPKGSVRLWTYDEENKVNFVIDFAEHPGVVNVAKFSPCGKMIASASEKLIVLYTINSPLTWSEVTDIKQVSRKWIRPSLQELFDLAWSPDSSHIAISALDGKAEIIRIEDRDSMILPGHTSYVQGIAWDPYNKMIATESSDRSCKIHMLRKADNNGKVRLAPRGHVVIKMHGGFQSENGNKTELQSGEGDPIPVIGKNVGINLFADSNVPSFFRRLSFSCDGSLLITPTGIYRGENNGPITPSNNNNKNKSNIVRPFCTHIFHRDNFSTPCVSLVGLEDPSVGIKFNPRLFKFVDHGEDGPAPLFKGNYRMMYAVITISSVLVYDTQHPHPLVKLTGLHYAPINDAAWSGDGHTLIVCSSDGYLSFIRFTQGSLGEIIPDNEVPDIVKIKFPSLYGPVIVPVLEDAQLQANQEAINNAEIGNNEQISEPIVSDIVEPENNLESVVEENKTVIEEPVKIPAETKELPLPTPITQEVQAVQQTSDVIQQKSLASPVQSTSDPNAKKRKRIQSTFIGSIGTVVVKGGEVIKLTESSSTPVPIIPSTSSSSTKPMETIVIEDSCEPIVKQPRIQEQKEIIIDDDSNPHAPPKPIMVSTPNSKPDNQINKLPTSSSSSSSAPQPTSSSKKRITPTLISTLHPTTSSSSPSTTNYPQ